MENETSDLHTKQDEVSGQGVATVTVVLESVALVIIIVSAVFGNAFIGHVIRKNRRLHCFVFICVLSQAISDILMALLVMPFTALTISTGKWMSGDFICSVQGALILVFSWTSLHTMALIALNRFFRVVKTHLYRRLFTKCSVITMIASIWLLALFLSLLPVALDWGSFHFHPLKSTCFSSFRDNLRIQNTVYTVVTMILYVILPIGIISFSYWNVFKVVRHHQLAISPSSNGNPRLNVEEIKVIWSLFASMIGFAVCWIPVIVIETLDTTFGDLPRAAHLAYVFLAFLSCLTSPLIYMTMHRQFRTEFYRLFQHINHS